MYVLRTINSFKISFWIVPDNKFFCTFCSSPATTKADKTGKTAPFIVIDTDILSNGISLNKIFMSSTVSMATPALPTSPITKSSSES